MPGRGKPIQTKLTPVNNDNAWKTIGRAKRQVQSTESSQGLTGIKKSDTKPTPPRPIELPAVTQDPHKTSIPDVVTSSQQTVSLDEMEFPSLPPNTKSIARMF
jgi:hypothetical protein